MSFFVSVGDEELNDSPYILAGFSFPQTLLDIMGPAPCLHNPLDNNDDRIFESSYQPVNQWQNRRIQ